jgi:hypothetical protein
MNNGDGFWNNHGLLVATQGTEHEANLERIIPVGIILHTAPSTIT